MEFPLQTIQLLEYPHGHGNPQLCACWAVLATFGKDIWALGVCLHAMLTGRCQLHDDRHSCYCTVYLYLYLFLYLYIYIIYIYY